ncbi:MAG: hypothetical protein JW797_15610, partial [Bradymonadales bacterium]|nr:hypothetical protein [Bradymonadales bacterium]
LEIPVPGLQPEGEIPPPEAEAAGTAPVEELAIPQEPVRAVEEPAAQPELPVEVQAAAAPLSSLSVLAGVLAPPASVMAADAIGDYGGRITITWERSPDDRRVFSRVRNYLVFFQAMPPPPAAEGEVPAPAELPGEPLEDGQSDAEPQPVEWVFLARVPAGVFHAEFDRADRGTAYRFLVVAASIEPDDQVLLAGIPVGYRVLLSDPVITSPVESIDDLLAGDDGAHPAPPTDLVLRDVPWDRGEELVLTWTASADDRLAYAADHLEDYADYLYRSLTHQENLHPLRYELLLRTDPEAFWTKVDEVPAGVTRYVYTGLTDDTSYQAMVVAATSEGHSGAAELVPLISPVANWFDGSRFYIGLLGLILSICILAYIEIARRGHKPFIRKIAGLEAIDEAIGRATEMGRPILFVPGISDMDNVQTLAGLSILGHVAKTIAEYDTRIDIPVCRALVMTAGREVVKQAYLQAGRPDAYDANCCHYITDEQFGYVAGVDGIIVRDKPATCFFQGAFYAESLILAETGNLIGAIQIAGTAMPSQLPFFIAACDYTLIGEELFAASAYLSGDPKQLGSLKGQDAGKLIVMLALVFGSLTATVAHLTALKFHSVSAVLNDIVVFLHRVFE